MDDFKEQCRRSLGRTLEERLKYAFFKQYKPVLDDAPIRIFKTMKDYREWADKNLPRYLGYKIVRTTDHQNKLT